MKILLIGTEKNLVTAILRELGEAICKIRYVADGDLGLEIALEGRFDLIILDWYTQKTNGLSVMRKFREHNKRTPILILAEGKSLRHIILTLDSYSEVCVHKPTDIQDVITKINVLIGTTLINQYSSLGIDGNTLLDEHEKIKPESQNQTMIFEQIGITNCRTKPRGNNVWECLEYRYTPCIHRAFCGHECYCLSKDNSKFSILSGTHNNK